MIHVTIRRLDKLMQVLLTVSRDRVQQPIKALKASDLVNSVGRTLAAKASLSG